MSISLPFQQGYFNEMRGAWKLELPDYRAAVDGVKECLESWLSDVRAGKSSHKYFMWLFNNSYHSPENFADEDMGIIDALCKAARELGLRPYYAKFR